MSTSTEEPAIPAVNNSPTPSTPRSAMESSAALKERDDESSSMVDEDRPAKGTRSITPHETEALRLKQKCKDLKQKIVDIETQNQIRAIGVSRAKDSISRLRFEYSLLLESLEKKNATLPFPDLKNFKPEDIDAETVSSLSLTDVTNLLSTTPLALANIKRFLPNALGDLISERQQQYINQAASSDQQAPSTSRTRRKRGTPNGSSASSRKRIRDPREPKRPTNAYLFFCDSERERVKSEWAEKNPNQHIDLSKAMTEVWRKMTDEDKKPYFEMYEKDKQRYQKAVEEFANIKEQERLNAQELLSSRAQSETASAEPETPVNGGFELDAHPDPDISQLDDANQTNEDIDENEGVEGEGDEEEDVDEDEEEEEEEEEANGSRLSTTAEVNGEPDGSEDLLLELDSEAHIEGEDGEDEDAAKDVTHESKDTEDEHLYDAAQLRSEPDTPLHE
ncbi:uncharacterized protein C5L36_0B02310 [Pichia kudriavzevii]|uniref:Non-histone protein 10 n=1 Tax=Pichia kudriavzevii TaxID=4909 RepID=A0A1V2LNM5_PICKU|nr:uncharacterized protein C5L36_0B02310 [Pichia kudriavzevii]AWU74969.1 hypothetical protein C5L36_0B02310 [Pichia kudriavzevii]ONH74862.1 Non-histone protein 10 [Pichia kudriavzevii]